MSDVVYLYGLVPADAPAPPGELTGLAGAPVELLRVGDTAAVIARLPAGDYGAAAVEARLQDLAWVGEQGMAHERVVLWFVDHADILPARLFSMYGDEQALCAALAPRQAQVARAFTALAGRREWNLKVAYDEDRLARHGAELSDELRSMDEEIAAAPPGRRYLLEKRRTGAVKREVAAAARRLADELLQALAGIAEQYRVLPAVEADREGSVVLNAALLVPRTAEAALRAEAERLAAEQGALGMIVSFSGPWAPYRFMEDDDVA